MRPPAASHEGTLCNQALHVDGLHGPGDKISLFLQERELAKGGTQLPHGPPCCARKCMRPGSWLWLPDEPLW